MPHYQSVIMVGYKWGTFNGGKASTVNEVSAPFFRGLKFAVTN
jgi:hypothetical protein